MFARKSNLSIMRFLVIELACEKQVQIISREFFVRRDALT